MKGNCGECDRRWCCDIDPDKCNEWPDPVPMTNADRIREMSDEELAERFTEFFIGGVKAISDMEINPKMRKDLVQLVIEQLQKPVKEDKHGTETD